MLSFLLICNFYCNFYIICNYLFFGIFYESATAISKASCYPVIVPLVSFDIPCIVICSVENPDPFESVSFWSAGSRSGQQKIRQNDGKFTQKSTKIIRISYVFFKNIELKFNRHSYQNKLFLKKYIFYKKKVKQKLVFIHVRSYSEKDPDPLQNETDLQHWLFVQGSVFGSS